MNFNVGDRVQLVGGEWDDFGMLGEVVTISGKSRFGECLFDYHNGEYVIYEDRSAEKDCSAELVQESADVDNPVEHPNHETYNMSGVSSFNDNVDSVLSSIGVVLKQKNEAYGNSALDPVRVFSKADTSEQLKVRIDDKLSRIKRGNDAGEDTILDLIGYLVLLKISVASGGEANALVQNGEQFVRVVDTEEE